MRTPLSSLDGRTYDVVIIGGGINGASAAQHIAARGYNVLIVDKGDFGSGSSSRSSRLLHCGLRYLAPGRSIWDFVLHPGRFLTALKMAKQAMEARAEFVATSSSRVREMRFAFPIYKDGPYRGWQVDVAFLILKLLGPKTLPLDYCRVPIDDPRATPLAQKLRDPDKVQTIALYREYEFDWPERICVDSILDAERLGASARNYTKAVLGGRLSDGAWPIELHDQVDGGRARVRANVVLNLAGIWIDEVNGAAAPNAQRRVLGTKGAHIVVKLPAQYAGQGVATLNTKNEPFYCIPWHDLHFFGPTETLYEANKDEIHVSDDERSWLLGEANRLLPNAQLTDRNVIMTWAGVRPLTFDPDIPFGNRSRILHDLASDGMPNVLAMTAGPVMSHRSAGRLLASEIGKRLEPSGQVQQPDYAPKVPPFNDNSPPLTSADKVVRLADLHHAIAHEHAIHLSDLLYRRTNLGWRHVFKDEEIEMAASVLAIERGLTDAQKQDEIRRFQNECERLFGRRR